MQGTIHGTATAGGAVLGLSAANGLGLEIPQLTLKQFGIVLGWSAISSGIAYLRKSPWARVEDDTEIIPKEAAKVGL